MQNHFPWVDCFILPVIFLSVYTTAFPRLTLQDRLVAWYPLNGNANDKSGNGFDRVVTGATGAENRFGSDNKACELDGMEDYIEIGSVTLCDSELSVS